MADSKVRELYSYFLESPGISTDTRSLDKGQIFFALKGPNFDGNKYAKQAIQKGASLAVIDESFAGSSLNGYFLVNDVLETLQNLASFHRQHLKTKIIAITGSNGKTTTKELTAAVLSSRYDVIYTQGNLNNHIGVPLTLLRLKSETEIGIIEMGANHVGEIEDLCKIAQPDYGLITNIGQAHLEGFGSLEGVKKGKGELYEYLKSSNGLIFINVDEAHLSEMVGDYNQVYAYSAKDNFKSGAQVNVTNRIDGLEFQIRQGNSISNCRLNLFGTYNAPNILAALNIGHYFSIPLPAMLEAIKQYVPDDRRSQVVETNRNTVILDAYNANPSSMLEAVNAFCDSDSRTKVMILGDMFELGKDTGEFHQLIVDHINSKFEGVLLLVGEHFSHTRTKKATVFRNREDLETYLKEHPVNDRYILIKGSRGMALESLIPIL